MNLHDRYKAIYHYLYINAERDEETGEIIFRPSLYNKHAVELMSLLNNQGGVTLIPDMNEGELSLCAREWVGYSGRPLPDETIAAGDGRLIVRDFLDADIEERYHAIVLSRALYYPRREDAYLTKCLDLLDAGGTLIAFVTADITQGMEYQPIRDRIMGNYSLEAVFAVQDIDCDGTLWDGSVLVIKNVPQTESVYMSLQGTPAQRYEGYRQGKGGFQVPAAMIGNRMDAEFYDPARSKQRDALQWTNTVRLGEIADVLSWHGIAPRQRTGNYRVITCRDIHDQEVLLPTKGRVYCDKESLCHIESFDWDARVLRPGDVLVTTVREWDDYDYVWGIYDGPEDTAIADCDIYVIRAHEDTREWIDLFFHTNTGMEYLDYQLELARENTRHEYSVEFDLRNMAVPDIETMRLAQRIRQGTDLADRTMILFSGLGWDVVRDYRWNDTQYDLALFYLGRLEGVVDVNSYTREETNTARFRERLARCKDRANGARVFFFADARTYEYADGNILELSGPPRPWNAPVAGWDGVLLNEVRSIKEVVVRTEQKVDSLTELVQSLLQRLEGYQSLTERQLTIADSAEEQERILATFSDECTERIIGQMNAGTVPRDRELEELKLRVSFGEPAWGKMSESSKTFLVTAKVMFNSLVRLGDDVDYSGVCLLVTKGLEAELKKRFLTKFVEYLEQKYPIAQYPSSLTYYDKEEHQRQVKRDERITLGSMAHILCLKESDNESRRANDRNKLMEYSKAVLFPGMSDTDIANLLHDYADSIEDVKERFRNPAAHTGELRVVQAEECFYLLLDVEKLMKRMLDSFNV